MKLLDKIKGGIMGLAVGDAVGVPFEFLDKEDMKKSPAVDMIGYGTHNQPPGTWSDDSSLTFCLMESLCDGLDLVDQGKKFVKWTKESYWTPHGHVFDIGIGTKYAIHYLEQGNNPELCGGMDENSNGNGSLMRILPLAFFLLNEKDIEKRYQTIKSVSSLTHAHFRSILACFIYVEFAIQLINGKTKFDAYSAIKIAINDFVEAKQFNPNEVQLYDRILLGDIRKENEEDIHGNGYVLRSLEASLWCFLNSSNYEETVLRAVNLGDDTDTTAAIAGGLAGLYYKVENIPETWRQQLARYGDIEDLIHRFYNSLQ